MPVWKGGVSDKGLLCYSGGEAAGEVPEGRGPTSSLLSTSPGCERRGGYLFGAGVGGPGGPLQTPLLCRSRWLPPECGPVRWGLGAAGGKPVAFGGTSVGVSEASVVFTHVPL